MLQLGLQKINKLLAANTGHWAGDRLICIGTGARRDELPPHVFTEEEEENILESGLCLWDYAEREFDNEPEGYERMTPDPRMSTIEKRQYQALTRHSEDYAWEKDPGQRWVLCNLTKRQYVRQSTVRAQDEAFAPSKAGFGGFLLSQICWSTDGSVAMQYGDIINGGWIGDRFEITTMDSMKDDGRRWEDVSDAIGDQMEAIYEAQGY